MGVVPKWLRKFTRNIFVETWFELRLDGSNQFGSVDYFAWPYLVTAERKEAIANRLLAPRAALLLVASILVASSFEFLRLQYAAMLGLCMFLTLRQWPRVWAGLNLADCSRLEKVKVRKGQVEAFELSRPSTAVSDLSLSGMVWALGVALSGLLVWFGIGDGKLGRYFFLGIFCLLIFSHFGLSVVLNWVFRPRVPPLREAFNANASVGAGWRLDGEGGEGGDGGGDGGGD